MYLRERFKLSVSLAGTSRAHIRRAVALRDAQRERQQVVGSVVFIQRLLAFLQEYIVDGGAFLVCLLCLVFSFALGGSIVLQLRACYRVDGDAAAESGDQQEPGGAQRQVLVQLAAAPVILTQHQYLSVVEIFSLLEHFSGDLARQQIAQALPLRGRFGIELCNLI